jgi:hypothetical protein
MRPRASGTAVHPEAVDWASRVTTNGGTVSTNTLAAVSTFCAAIATAGIRSKFRRINLLCGNSDGSLNAVRTPLFISDSIGGTLFGSAMDATTNLVAGDYTENGATGGLAGNGSNKFLDTGLAFSSIATQHLSVGISDYGTSPYRRVAGTPQFLFTHDGITSVVYGIVNTNGFSNVFATNNTNPVGTLFTFTSSGTSQVGYQNSTQNGTGGRSSPSSADTVRILRVDTSYTPARVAGYSIGEVLTQSEVAAYYAAWKAFQSSLGRPA